jgi:ABC-type branched-chain amino acid transport systems, periplasmic component
MKRNSVIALLLVCSLLLATACSKGTNKGAASGSNLNGTVTFGVVAALSGTNKATGVYVKNGAELAVEQINANGGILGKKLVLTYADEVDNMQASVNAVSKLINQKEVMAIFGSTYSTNCVAVLPTILDKKITMFAGGSSAGIPKQKNPYVWQPRMTDDKTGIVMASVASKTLGMKNPAIMYSTQASTQALAQQTIQELAKLGVTVKDSNVFGFAEEEKNYSPIITQIMNSGADGVIAIANQLPAAMICQQAEAAGLNIPRLGSSSWASVITRQNAGNSANGWYAIADWTVEASTEQGKAFAKAYKDKYSADSDMPSAAVYDSIMLFKKACELAGTTTDREAINEALKKVKDVNGAMNTYSYFDDHCFATGMFVTKNANGVATMVDTAKVR